MNRKLRNTLPTVELRPNIPNYSKVKKSEATRREKQKENFDTPHRARNLPLLQQGDVVWIPGNKCMGRVLTEVAPRSYTVETAQGTLRRNCRQLVVSPSNASDDLDLIPDIPSDESIIEQPRVNEQSLQHLRVVSSESSTPQLVLAH